MLKRMAGVLGCAVLIGSLSIGLSLAAKPLPSRDDPNSTGGSLSGGSGGDDPNGAGSASELFSSVGAQSPQLSSSQREIVRVIEKSAATANTRIATIAADLDTSDELNLNLFSGQTITAVRTGLDQTARRSVWSGNIAGEAGRVLLVSHGGNISGLIIGDNQVYSIRPLGGGIQAIARLYPNAMEYPDPAGFDSANLEDPSYDDVDDYCDSSDTIDDSTCDPGSTTDPGVTASSSSYGVTISVMVAYTPAAAADSGDIEGDIDLMIAQANESYGNSGIGLRLALANVTEVNYVESNTETSGRVTDLVRLQDPADGFMDGIHDLRDENFADVVVLIVESLPPPIAGEAFTIRASADTAFAVLTLEGGLNGLDLPHEVGHLQGARHNTQEDPSNSPFAYGHGRYRRYKHYRTIMSYDCPGGCVRRMLWSNPDVKFDGVKAGDARRRDNARVLDETAGQVANFRQAPSISNGRFAFSGSWTGAGTDSRGWHVGDFNGDGRDDIFRYQAGNSGADVFLSNGVYFAHSGSWTGAGDGEQGWYVGDFNGDGKDDIFRYVEGLCGAEVFISDGSRFVNSGCWTGAGTDSRGWHVGDFDGDGRDDIFRYVATTCGAEVFRSNGSKFLGGVCWTGAGDGDRGWLVGDFNGDGRDDISRYIGGTCGAEVWRSNGSGFTNAGCWTGAGDGLRGWKAGDFDGDGATDIFRYIPTYVGADAFLSTTSSFTHDGGWTLAGDGDQGWYVGDFDGDGHDDIFRYNGGISGAEVFLAQ